MLAADLRDAGRAMRRRPIHALVSIVTLTIGVGAMVAIFSLANVLLFRPIPGVKASAALVRVMSLARSGDGAYPMSYPLFEAARDGVPAFSGLATRTQSTVDVATSDAAAPRRVASELVSGNYFDILGVRVAGGRAIASEDVNQGALVAVAGPRVCRSADAEGRCLGTSIQINGLRYEIVGVMGERFRGADVPAVAELWLPMTSTLMSGRNDASALKDRGTSFLRELVG